jgi:hypothetical protein
MKCVRGSSHCFFYAHVLLEFKRQARVAFVIAHEKKM